METVLCIKGLLGSHIIVYIGNAISFSLLLARRIVQHRKKSTLTQWKQRAMLGQAEVSSAHSHVNLSVGIGR